MYRSLMIVGLVGSLFSPVDGCWPVPPAPPDYGDGYDVGYAEGWADGEHGYACSLSPLGNAEHSEDFISGRSDGYHDGYRDGEAEAERTRPRTVVGAWGPVRMNFMEYGIDYEVVLAENGRFAITMTMTVYGVPEILGGFEQTILTGSYGTDALPDPDHLTLYVEEISRMGLTEDYGDGEMRLPFIYEIGEDGLRIGAAWPFWDAYQEPAQGRPASFDALGVYEMKLPRQAQ